MILTAAGETDSCRQDRCLHSKDTMRPAHRLLGAIVLALSSQAATASADTLALTAVEGRMGAGIAMGGGQGGSTLKRSPFRAGALPIRHRRPQGGDPLFGVDVEL